MQHDTESAGGRAAPFHPVNDTGGVETTARTATADVAADARERASTVRDVALAQTRRAGTEIRGQAMATVTEGKSAVADQLGGIARSLRTSGDELRTGHQPQLASLNDTLASGLERTAGYLRDRDLEGMAGDARRMARHRPLLFFGGLFALGAIAAGAMRLEEQRPHDRPTGRKGGIE